MAFTLEAPVVVTHKQTSFVVTGIVNNVEEKFVDVHFMTLLEDGSPFQRGVCRIAEGYEQAKALYADLDSRIAAGASFEDASTAICEERLKAVIGG